MSGLLILLGIVAFIILAYRGRAFSGIITALVLIMLGASGLNGVGVLFSLIALIFAGIIIFLLVPVSRHALSKKVMQLMGKAIPPISETEETALQAGNLWFDEQLFSGNPDWRELLDFPMTGLSQEEQTFLNGPVRELCSMLDDEAIAQARELPEVAWQFIKQERFLGMVIEKKYGGLGFSASGHAAVISQIATVSIPVAITVMVPNSLGPGELLHYYGTAEQKNYYLPRLAEGKEIPCFALTEPHAGSDAANSRSVGIVCKDMHEGQEVLGIRLKFNKRYITLAPVASLVGLAFNLQDPDALLGEKKNIGITCALLPRNTQGMQIGEHHDPMGIPFPNGPVYGEDVFIPMDYVIGGQGQLGNGWRMLMECLAVGRSISLPSLSIGGAQFAVRSMSAYTVLREQFGLPLASFEGVRAPLARIYANAYWMTATRNVTCAAVDAGNKPSVLSAIVKYYLTEGMRESINHAMDIQGGAAICRGPRNLLSRTYTALPIAITVEGANILTRSLIIFGQGAMRCHPFLLKELRAIAEKNTESFDRAFFGHVNHVFSNFVRAFVQAISFEKIAPSPVSGKAAVHYRKLSRLSAGFALLADMGLLTLAGALKRKEYLSGRYADALAWLYIGSATLKRYQEEGQDGDWPLVDYSLTHAEQKIEQALFGILQNFPNRILAWKLRIFILPWGHRFKGVSDRQREAVVKLMQNSERDFCARLCSDVYVPNGDMPGLGKLEVAFAKAVDAGNVRDKLKSLIKAGTLEKGIWLQVAENAHKQGLIDEAEYKLVSDAEQAADDIIQVDRFAHDEFLQRK